MNSLKRTLWAAAIITAAILAPVAQSARADDAVPAAPAAKADIPLGSADFYPSSERPIGWRGDGTGAFPGATPVTTWNSKTDKNIVWKTQMPAPSWGQPIVLGEKVFTMADPNLLICVNIKDGKILWQKEVDHTTLMPEEKAKKAKEELAAIDALFPIYVDGCRLMAKMQALAKQKGINEGELRTAVLKLGSIGSIYDTTKNYKSADYDKAIADAELKPMLEQLIELRKKYAFSFTDPKRGSNWYAIEGDYRNSTAGKALNERIQALVTNYDIWAWPVQNWYACTTLTFATPCSDGEFIYVACANNQVASYDLDGNLKWMVLNHPKEGQNGLIHTRFVASPFLVGDKLVVDQNTELSVYDKKTGKKIWGIVDPCNVFKDKHGRVSRPYRPYPEGCSPVHVRLPFQGKDLDFIADASKQLYRLSDGKVVCKTMPPSFKGQTPIAVGDLYVWKSGGDASPYPIGVSRLKVISEDEVECTELWKDTMARCGEDTGMVYNGVIYNDNGTWDLLTGKRLATYKSGISWNSPIVTGDHIVGSGGSRVISIKQAGQITQNLLEDDINVVDPEWDRKVYCGQTGTFGHASWYAAGNRLFFRTAGYLWCIGDKAQPFKAPTNCPEAAKIAK